MTYCQSEDDEFPPGNWADSILSNQDGEIPQSDGSKNDEMNPFGANLGEMLKMMEVEQLLTLLGEYRRSENLLHNTRQNGKMFYAHIYPGAYFRTKCLACPLGHSQYILWSTDPDTHIFLLSE